MTPRVLQDFAGDWTLVREIAHANGDQAQFEGRALWTPDQVGLMCREEGYLRVGSGTGFRAARSYLWAEDLQVRFEDGRFFHQVPACGGPVSHDCPPDRYEGVYDFSAWPLWTLTWRVRGPRKAYDMTSRYSRI